MPRFRNVSLGDPNESRSGHTSLPLLNLDETDQLARPDLEGCLTVVVDDGEAASDDVILEESQEGLERDGTQCEAVSARE